MQIATGTPRDVDTTGKRGMLSIEHLRDSILQPSGAIAPKYRFVQLSMKRGEDLEGILLNEDTYSIQLMNGKEELMSVAKSDITEIFRPEISLMPDYLEAFSDKELTDLVAYLHSLGGSSAVD